MTIDASECCPSDAGNSLSNYLDCEIAGLVKGNVGRFTNGERANFKQAGWEGKLFIIRCCLDNDISKESKALKDAVEEGETKVLRQLRSELAYTQSLEVGMRIAKLIKWPGLVEPQTMHLPLLDSVGRETSEHVLRHLALLCSENNAEQPDFARQSFAQFTEGLCPETAYSIASIGSTVVSASLLVDEQRDLLVGLDLEFRHESLVGYSS